MKLGLLGRKLGHSYSPAIHAMLGDPGYGLYEAEPEALGEFLKSGSFDGLNVTIPYKKAVLPYLSRMDENAERLGNVNTVVREPDGSLTGYNTDFFGFSELLRFSGFDVSGQKVLVLGTGGASETVRAVLEDEGAEVIRISRTGENNYENLGNHADARFLVNATPVGMYPGNLRSPVEIGQLPNLRGVIDLIYNPARTKLMLDAEGLGIPAFNGLRMLAAQAVQASEFFHRTKIDPAKIDEIHRKLRFRMENLILVGMAGCGKTAVGQLIAQKTGKIFVDSDAEIEALAGKSIPAIFTEDGEDRFRDLETQVLERLGKGSRQVIATGGGCVTKARNYAPLHQNGTLIWLRRDPRLLPTSGRPLSMKTAPEVLYRKRLPLYEAFSDLAIENDRTPEEAAESILKEVSP